GSRTGEGGGSLGILPTRVGARSCARPRGGQAGAARGGRPDPRRPGRDRRAAARSGKCRRRPGGALACRPAPLDRGRPAGARRPRRPPASVDARAGRGPPGRHRRRDRSPPLASVSLTGLRRHIRRQPREPRGCRGASTGPGGSVSLLEQELLEQPAALARLLERQSEHADELGELLRRDDMRYLLIASRGGSSNAARYAQYLLGRASRVPVAFATPSLYTLYEQPPRLDGALVVGISQSGESPDVRAVVDEARRQGRPTIALTNAPGSPLARGSDAVLLLEAGEGRAGAATKTYLNSLRAIPLLFAASTRDAQARLELERMPAQIAAQLERSFEDVGALDRLEAVESGTVVGRGINYGSAFEIALKIRELSGLLFEA